jgi:hypothetical protein
MPGVARPMSAAGKGRGVIRAVDDAYAPEKRRCQKDAGRLNGSDESAGQEL